MEPPPRILIVDDDRELCELLVELLEAEHLSVEAVYDGREGLERARTGECSLVVLDVMLPGLGGFDVLRELRRSSDVPVLMLTARGKDVDRIVGLEMGADDYLAKPFNPRELIARIRAIQRRAPPTYRTERVELGDIVIDTAARSVTVGGVALELTTTEYRLLEVLLRHAGRVVSRELLSRQVLERRFSPLDRSIDVHVSSLRKKLDEHFGRSPIKTVRGHGYLYAREARP